MSNPTISILSRRRFRLTKTRCPRRLSRGRRAVRSSPCLSPAIGSASPLRFGLEFEFWEGLAAASLAVLTGSFYHGRRKGPVARGPAIESEREDRARPD